MPNLVKKPWWQSKTLIFNAVALGLITFEANMHYLQPMLSTDVYGVIAVVLAVGNKVLRFVTTQPLSGFSSVPLDPPTVITTTSTTEESSNG